MLRRTWKRLGIAGLALLLAVTAFVPARPPAAEATTLGYARAFSGSTPADSSEGYGIAVDSSGKAHLAGRFAGTVDFDPGGGTANLSSVAAGRDGYVARLDASGNLVAGSNLAVNGNSDDIASAVVLDNLGNSYTTGVYRDTTTTGDRNQAYVLKILADGTPTTPVFFGGPGHASGKAIAVDASGNIYLTGNFSGVIDFNPGAGTSNLTSASGSNDVFAVKMNSSGSLLWTAQFGSTGNDQGNGIALDGTGNVYLTGQFVDTVDFDPGAGTSNLTSSSNSSDAFAVKLNSSGGLVWAKQFGGTGTDFGYGIAMDGAGNTHLTGRFEATVDFDPGPGTLELISAGNYDAFAIKLNSSGSLLWAKGFGGGGFDEGYGIALDGAGNVYVTGYFQTTADFDPGTGTTNLNSAGSSDAFAVKLDAAGAFVWAERFGGENFDQGNGITVDTNGFVYVTGGFRGNDIVFAPSSGGTATLSSNPASAIMPGAFIFKLAQVQPPANQLPAALQATIDEVPLVFSTANGNRISISDPDNGSSPLRVLVGFAVGQGTISLSTIAGLSFLVGDGVADPSMMFDGTLTAINAALDGLQYTPVLGGPTSATFTILTVDSPSFGQSDGDNFTITINRRPVAQARTYSMNAGNQASLTKSAAEGLLVGATGGAPLSAQVTTPAGGIFNLQPNGGFTYTPRSNFTGVDTFTYQAVDPQGFKSTPASVSITVNAASCGPRPPVTVTTSVSGGALQVTVTSTTNASAPNNRLVSLTFGAFTNAQVTLNGQGVSSGASVPLPSNPVSQSFTVTRATPGQATNVALTVMDSCGSWKTVVGGGTGAGF